MPTPVSAPLQAERPERAESTDRFGRRPEQELVRLCARTREAIDLRPRVRQLLDQELDWSYLLQWANRHCVLPLLHRQLVQTFTDLIPEEAALQLNTWARRTAMRNLQRTQELVRVLERLDASGIRALPFKGPTLGLLVYGDVSLRQFGDLDILVPQARFHQAKRLLIDDGYRPIRLADDQQEVAWMKADKSYELVRDDAMIELHWEFLHPMHGFYLDPQAVWTRTRSAKVGNLTVPALSREDLVLYLCAHGSKHFWSRLSWVCDVAEVLRTHRDELHWPTLIERAESLHGLRMLFLGLTLAHELLDAPLPEGVYRRAARNEAVQQLAHLARERLFAERPDGSAERAFEDARLELEDAHFHLLMRERLRDRLPYYRHLLQLALTPTGKDRAFVDLPPTLTSLYYLIRPLRLLREVSSGAMRLLRRLGG